MRFTKEQYKRLDKQLNEVVNSGMTIKEIANHLGISRSAVNRRLRALELNVPNYHNALKFDNTVFDSINSEEKAYWLGFLFADGYVSSDKNTVAVSLKDTDSGHLTKLKNFFKATNHTVSHRKVRSNGKEYDACSFQVCDKHLKSRLIELGCHPRKSLILTFPNASIFANPDLVYPFIRGYVDGDGCLTFSKSGRLEISILGTEAFLSGIQKAFPDRFKSIHHIKRTKSDICKISNTGTNADYVANILYQGANIYLQRKFDRFAVLSRNIQDYQGAKTVEAEMLIPC